MPLKFINHVFLIFLFNISHFIKAQNITPAKIDSISKISWAETKNNDYLKFNQINKILLEESQKLDYEKGIAKAYYNLGISYKMLGGLDEAVLAFNEFKKSNYSQTKYSMLAETDRYIGECYFQQNLFDNAIEKFKSAIRFGKNAGEKEFAINAVNYNNIAAAMDSNSGNKDSIYYYSTKAFFYIKNLSGKVTPSDESSLGSGVTVNLADIWDERNRMDSAQYYYNKAIEYNNINNNVGANMFLKHRIGNFFLKHKNYKDAENSYRESIDLAIKAKNIYCLKDNYKSIRQLYKEMNKKDNYQKYSELYIDLSDTLATLQVRTTKASINNIVKEKESDFQKSEQKLYWVIGGIIFFAILISFIAFWFHQNMKKKKENIISDAVIKLAQKREIIEEKEKETQELKLKINESFDEVVQLAKENSLEFLIRFQEVYPDYYQKLITIEPRLLITEVKLCTMIYLGFSTKDIAEYTYVTIKAAQHRKFRLRKKLSIPSEVEINIWLNEV